MAPNVDCGTLLIKIFIVTRSVDNLAILSTLILPSQVAAAREAAQQQALEEAGPDIAQGDIHVALPDVNIRPRRAPYPGFLGYPLQAAGPANRAANLNQAQQGLRDQLQRLRKVRNRYLNGAEGLPPPALDGYRARPAELLLRADNIAVEQGVGARGAAPARGRPRDLAAAAPAGVAEYLAHIQRLREQILARYNPNGAAADAPALGRVDAAQDGQRVVAAGELRPGNAQNQEQIQIQAPPGGAERAHVEPARDRNARQRDAPRLIPAVAPNLPAFLAALRVPADFAAERPPQGGPDLAQLAAQLQPLRQEAEMQPPAPGDRFAPAVPRPQAAAQPRQVVAPEERARLLARNAVLRQRQMLGPAGVLREAGGLEAQDLRRLAEVHGAANLADRLGGRLAEPAQEQQGGNHNFVSKLCVNRRWRSFPLTRTC